jgi:hypothetical protein
LYGLSFQSLTNVDTPYVYFAFGIPEMGEHPKVYGLPYLTMSSNIAGAPDDVRTDVPWATLDSETNTIGWMTGQGYVLDVNAGGYVGASFSVTTYPGLRELIARDPDGIRRAITAARPWWTAEKLDQMIEGLQAAALDPDVEIPEECVPLFAPFRFNVFATATPMTRDEFLARQIRDAEVLRAKVLADPTASVALANLAADADAWDASYLGALEDGGLLRPENLAPPIRTSSKVVSTVAMLASGVLIGPPGARSRATAIS